MNVSEIIATSPFEVIYMPEGDHIVSGAYTSDLLSDVMGHAPDESVLITVQAHKNTVAVASLAGLPAVVLCHSRPIPDDMLDAARQEGIALIRTPENQFETSCRIKQLLELSA